MRAGDDIHRNFSHSAPGDLDAKSPKHKRVLRGVSVVPGAKHDLYIRFENIVVPVLDVDFERAVRQRLYDRGMGAGGDPIISVFHAHIWIGERGGIWV